MAIYFTSDFHFGHEKKFLWQPRGFNSWEEAAARTIENYNNVVQDEDVVYILGDCMLKNDEFGITCLKQLKGHKYLAFGNHDTDSRIERFKLEHIFEDIEFGYRMRFGKYSFWMTHYPMKMGNFKEKHPVWNISGHTHKKSKLENGDDCIYNVALDAHNNYPVPLEKIISDIKEYRKLELMSEAEKLEQILKTYTQDLTLSVKRCDTCAYIPETCGHDDSEGACSAYRREILNNGYYN